MRGIGLCGCVGRVERLHSLDGPAEVVFGPVTGPDDDLRVVGGSHAGSECDRELPEGSAGIVHPDRAVLKHQEIPAVAAETEMEKIGGRVASHPGAGDVCGSVGHRVICEHPGRLGVESVRTDVKGIGGTPDAAVGIGYRPGLGPAQARLVLEDESLVRETADLAGYHTAAVQAPTVAHQAGVLVGTVTVKIVLKAYRYMEIRIMIVEYGKAERHRSRVQGRGDLSVFRHRK